MWTCSKCKRTFSKINQPHSCKVIPLQKHFENKEKAKELFDYLVEQISSSIGKCKIISLPCCIHLFGKYDFLAALPKKGRLEIHFVLDRKLRGSRPNRGVLVSTKTFLNCINLFSKKDIDKELICSLKVSYHLKD